MDPSVITELLHRRRVNDSLNEWAKVCGYVPAEHHKLINARLQEVEQGTCKRLLIMLPPGSAKSTYATKLFPAWYLNRREGRAIICASHSADLAESFGRYTRNLIEQQRKYLCYELSKHSQAAGRWETTNSGSYLAAGVGGRIAGYRADLALIDDPVGSREDADSKLIRDKHWDWYSFDLKSRLKPDAAIILIQTRWHEDDLAGRILEAEKNDWTVICIPFIAEDNDILGRSPGTRLWSEYFNDAKEQEARSDPRAFSALYQQRPAPESGDFFKKEWLIPYGLDEIKDKELRIYCGSDHAISLDQSADRTCLLPIGVDSRDNIYVLPDIFWTRAGSEDVVENMLRMMQRRRPVQWWAERGHISKSLGPFLNKRMSEERVWTYIEEVTPVRDKQSRAQSIRGRMAMGRVRFPTFAPWWPDAMHELLTFPTGKHDDFVDALAHIGMGLDRTTRPQLAIVEVEQDLNKPFVPTFKWLKDDDNRRLRREALMRADY